MSKSKVYEAAAAKIDRSTFYNATEAVHLAKETGSKKFDSTVEVALKLAVDPRKADQMVRGTVILPHGTGKTARVIVFATGPAAEAAIAAGADEVGGAELIERVAGGWVDFDAAVSTPELMGQVGRLGKVLGPRNLMPNPKTGTVTPNPAKAVEDIKGGKIAFRVDKHANVHFVVGKVSFTAEQLEENFSAAIEEIIRLKPSSAKGRYIQKGAVSTTFGPGIPLDVNTFA
ncbi:50S ribosomal protein L1 [Microbacterium memoriense]|uniref:Large ribosomal subunit protein uL1 n=1 Tax=Microbacterium memoriense TaxID=2978350 RepID=A0ABT2PED9_9MICO|nr:50S ribosomal protein L1 [Microbacterium memoriense]MCT9002174.1 50S ribosomal protein L1 [Microbacterium memoriense]